jgi:nitronate monooxygenase
MFLVSGPQLVLAACRAGIIGSFPTPNTRSAEELGQWMQTIVDGVDQARANDPAACIGPWAANLVTHSSNARLRDDLDVIARYRPPIVITALGSPRPAIEVVRGYGGLVFADVVSLKLARKAVDAGADGLACVSSGAGGHTGSLSPFAFISAVREFFDGIVIAGGAIADGWGVAGAIAAGADLVYMGTRFVPTHESMAVAEYKQMIVDCNVDDLIVSAGITGTPASWLMPSLQARGLDPDHLNVQTARDYDASKNAHFGRWKDAWSAGQGLGTVHAIEAVADVVDQLAHQYGLASQRFMALGTPS